MLPLKNNERKYGWLAQGFHWLMALLIIGMLCVGLYMVGMPQSLDKLKLYGLHKSTGIVVLFLVSLRYGWRQVNFQPEIPLENGRGITYPPRLYRFMNYFAKFWHVAIYFMMFLMPLTGWAMSSAVGFPVSVYGLFTVPNLVAPDKQLAALFKSIHDYTAYVLIFFIFVHIAAGLFHHFILKDIVMKRMLPVIILLLFSVPAFADAPVKFTVDKSKSSIKFEAVENGAPVTGEFKDYDAAIAFNPQDLADSKASVEIKMGSIASTYDELTTNLQAPEWFDVKKFPTAKFEVAKFAKLDANNYSAAGKLTIRDKTQDVVLKFALKEFDAKHAVIDGAITLSRNAFGVGQGEWKDTGSVKDEVKVAIHIEAKTSN